MEQEVQVGFPAMTLASLGHLSNKMTVYKLKINNYHQLV